MTLILMQCRKRIHSICTLTDIVKCITADAEGLLGSSRQLSLLIAAANVHRKRLTLRAHQLVVPTILISWYLVTEQIHLVMIATPLS